MVEIIGIRDWIANIVFVYDIEWHRPTSTVAQFQTQIVTFINLFFQSVTFLDGLLLHLPLLISVFFNLCYLFNQHFF